MAYYPDNMTLRPLVGWPGPMTRTRRRAPFKTLFSDTLTQLDRELRHLNGPLWGRRPAPSVLQIALGEADFRIDGMPRANSRPSHPGVILSIEPKPKDSPPLSFPCDTFDDWRDNLRAITLTLEALRKIDRYGVTQTGQQYTGWRAIESKPSEPVIPIKEAIGTLAAIADMPPPSSHEGIALAYRLARKAAHPDRNGGDQTRWDRVEQLAKVLRAEGWLD